MATATGLKPATEKLRSKQGKDEYKQKENRQERDDGSKGVEQTAHLAQRKPKPFDAAAEFTEKWREKKKKQNKKKTCKNVIFIFLNFTHASSFHSCDTRRKRAPH